MKFASKISELKTADGVAANDMNSSLVWLVENRDGDAPGFSVKRAYVGIGFAPHGGWAFIDYCTRPERANEQAIDTDTIFVSEAKARQRQAELYLESALTMTKTAAAAVLQSA